MSQSKILVLLLIVSCSHLTRLVAQDFKSLQKSLDTETCPKSLAVHREALAKYPDHPKLLLQTAELELKCGDVRKGEQLLAQIQATDTLMIDRLKRLKAYAFHLLGQPDLAIQQIEDIKTRDIRRFKQQIINAQQATRIESIFASPYTDQTEASQDQSTGYLYQVCQTIGSKSPKRFESVFENIYRVQLLPRYPDKADTLTAKPSADQTPFGKGNRLVSYQYNKRKQLSVSEQAVGDKWSDPNPFGRRKKHVNQGHVFLFDQGNSIILSLKREGFESRGKDLFIAYKNKNGKWTKAQPLHALNSGRDEESPIVTNQGKTIYFSSNRPSGIGGFDVFKSDYDSATAQWGSPINLGIPINSPSDDLYFTFDSTGTHGFVYSSRHLQSDQLVPYIIGRKGQVLIQGQTKQLAASVTATSTSDTAKWKTTSSRTHDFRLSLPSGGSYLLSEAQQSKVDTLTFPLTAKDTTVGAIKTTEATNKIKQITGKVQSSMSQPVFGALVQIYSNVPNRVVAQSYTDFLGKFQIEAPLEEMAKYHIDIQHGGIVYANVKQFEGTKIKNEDGLQLHIEEQRIVVTLAPITQGDLLVFNSVDFDFNSFELRPESKHALHILKNMMLKNPSLRIKFRGYADSEQDPTYNLWLSEQRAQAVANYLGLFGIDLTRIETEGYSSDKEPLNHQFEIEIVNW